jgi:hypothetical protein
MKPDKLGFGADSSSEFDSSWRAVVGSSFDFFF